MYFRTYRAHIISAPLANYLVKNKSRFRLSHEFQLIPLETMNRIFSDEAFSLQIQHHNKKAFFVCKAFDYIYRPRTLQQISMYEFFSHYESVGLQIKGKKGSHPVLQFQKKHPESGNRGIRKHNRNVILKFSSWAWPNTKRFDGTIFRPNVGSLKAMDYVDKFAWWTLLFFFTVPQTQ